MTDVTQGADAPDDNALFQEATSTTLEKFENPELPKPAEPEKPAGEVKPEPKPDAKPDPEMIPSGRLREESEARRRAERERDELRARLDNVFARQPPAQPQPKQEAPDLFENPKGFVQAELKPFLDQIQQNFQAQREAMSLDFAVQRHGDEVVSAARQSLEQGMQRGDQNAWATYNRAMQSHDPYGVIVKWHREGETLRTIGGDLEAYRKSVIEDALKDPETQKRFLEAARGQASANGNSVNRPVKSGAASSPSLGDVGASGGDPQLIEPSDMDLFRQATSAKRR